MAIPTLNAIGFCAHYSKPGDWAFDYALRLSRMHEIPLNVFHFLEDPYDPNGQSVTNFSKAEKAKLAIERERELRIYYDTLAGDYLEVGFRLCEDNEWTELHRCLIIREFQILVLGYVRPETSFAGYPIEKFANDFICPVVLVGPDNPDQFRLNSRAALIVNQLGLPNEHWSEIGQKSA